MATYLQVRPRQLPAVASGIIGTGLPRFQIRRICCEIGDLTLEQFNNMRRIELESFEYVPADKIIPIAASEFEEKRYMHRRYGCNYGYNGESFVTHIIELRDTGAVIGYGRDRHKKTVTETRATFWKGAIDPQYRGMGIYKSLARARLAYAVEAGFTLIGSYFMHPNVAPAMVKALQDLCTSGMIGGYTGTINADSLGMTVDINHTTEISDQLKVLLRGRKYNANMRDPEVQALAKKLKGALSLRLL